MRASLPLAAAIAVLVPAIFVPAASAATVTLTSTVSTGFDEGERVVGQSVDVAVEASNGERNAMTLATTAGEVRVADAGAPLTAGKGCVQDGPSAARCPVVRTTRRIDTFSLDMQARLGDGADRWTSAARAAGSTALAPSEVVFGGPGDDDVTAPEATAYGDAGNDHLVALSAGGGTGNDTIVARTAGGDPGDDVLTGHVLSGGAGNDALTGGPEDDELTPGIGSDTVDGGAGNDELDYPNHPHGLTIDLRATPGLASGGGERDTVASVERVTGTSHADVIRGGPGSERLDGAFGRDRIFGGGGDDELGSEDARAELHGGDGDDFLIRVGPKSDCGAGIDTFAAPDGVLRLGRVRAGCELASPDLEDQLDTADPSIVVDSVRVRRGRLEIAFVSDEAKSRRIDVELFKRGKRLAFVQNVRLRGGVGRLTSFRVPLTALGRRTFAAGKPVVAALYLDADAPLGSQLVQIDR